MTTLYLDCVFDLNGVAAPAVVAVGVAAVVAAVDDAVAI